VAEATDAARDRVLAARSALAEEIDLLEASARAAVDVPAKIRRSPAKAAAIAGGTGFLVLGGPGRVFRGVKRVVRGPGTPLPKSMLPKEIEKAVRALGKDGDQVRGALERDFAAYAKQAGRDRARLRSVIVLSVARPLLTAGTKALAGWLFRADDEGVQSRLAQIRARAEGRKSATETPAAASKPSATERAGLDDESGSAGA
jgi:hypothetical protein